MSEVENFLENKQNIKLSEEEIKGNYFKTIMALVKSGIDKREVLNVFQEYEKKKVLYKNNKIYFNDYFKTGFKHENLEKFRDDLYKVNVKINYNHMLRRLKSKNNLINEETKELTLGLAEEGLDVTFINDIVGDKIASLSNSEGLNKILKEQLKYIQGEWNMNSFKEKLQGKNVNIISDTENKLVIAVNDFNASSKLGTNNWCLVRNKSDYDYYANAEDGYKRINFIYDFNKSPDNNDSMIASLTRINGEVYETYNRKDDRINNQNVIDIDFPEMSRDRLKELINQDFPKNTNPIGRTEELINYGFYEEAKKAVLKSKSSYQTVLSTMFSNRVGKVTFSGDVISFFEELERNDVSYLNGYELPSWFRESIYLGDCSTVEKLLEKDFIKNMINEDFNHFKVDLTNIYTELFRNDSVSGFNFAKSLNEKFVDIVGKDKFNELSVFDLGKYSEEALDFIEKEMPFIKENELTDNMLNLLDFDYSEESMENYFKFMNITDKDIDILDELIEKAKVETLLQGKNNVFSKIRQPITKIIGKERFDKKATLTKEMLNVFGMLNQDIISGHSAAPALQDLTIFKIEKLNKEETENFLNILMGNKEKRVDNYNNSGVVVKSIFKTVISKHTESLDKDTVKDLMNKLNIKEMQTNKRKRRL